MIANSSTAPGSSRGGFFSRRLAALMRAVCALGTALAIAVMAHGADSGRRQMPLQGDWRFHFGDVPGATNVDFDDGAWEKVSVPHTWNAADATQRDFRRGPGWYRLRFTAPSVAAGERVYVEFRGVSLVATVWLNGTKVGTHANGFAAFRCDLTEVLRSGGNTLVVCADTTWRDELPPREGDFTLCGGIYRAVSLLITPAVAIDPLDHGSSGVYLATPAVNAAEAKVQARVRVRNALDRPESVTVRVALADADAAPVAEAVVTHRAPPGVSEAKLELTVARPHRWHGRRDPYLYSADVTLARAEPAPAVPADAVRQPLGFRTFRVDPEKGFFLNDEPYDLHGVNLHQDRIGSAWALRDADHEEDFRLMAELGCTFVRLVHYQHDEIDYALADKLGIVVWTEHALVNTVSANPIFTEHCLEQVRELIRQNFNHPSIVFWGIGNEVQTNKPPAKLVLELLSREVKLEDTGRLSTIATNHEEPFAAYGLDTIGHNQYHGWYHHTPEDFAGWLDKQRGKSPGQSLGVSEYGAGAGASIHRAAPVRMDHSEEYQAYYHEVTWRALRERPWIWCKTIWVMFDFSSAGRHEGEGPGINDKGLVSRDRATRKDAYFWYQSNWTEFPMVHINGRRFTPRPEPPAELRVYSNCEVVELRLNGRSLGTRRVDDHIVRWPAADFLRGENRIEAIGRRGSMEVKDECTVVIAPPGS